MQRTQLDDEFRHAGLRSNPLIPNPADRCRDQAVHAPKRLEARQGGGIGRLDVKIGHPRLGLSERQPGPDAEGLRGAIDGDDGAPSSVAPSDHRRPLRRRRGVARLPTQPIGRPGRQVERDDPSHRRLPIQNPRIRPPCSG